jgi:hypothetical protein
MRRIPRPEIPRCRVSFRLMFWTDIGMASLIAEQFAGHTDEWHSSHFPGGTLGNGRSPRSFLAT